MTIVLRTVFHVRMGRWQEAIELEKKWAAHEAQRGLPSKRYYRILAGSEDNHTLVSEQEWESFAALEASTATFKADEPEAQALLAQTFEVYTSIRREFYSGVPIG